MPPVVGRIYLGKYETMRLLGEGGMGSVFLARHLELDEPVVVKVMHSHIAGDPKFRESFQRETVLMAGFQHPNAVQFLDASSDDPNGPCIVMEFIPGVTLDKLLAKNGRFSPMRIRRILAQLCDVLQAAHDEGIMHRDLKPANLMIVDPDTPFEKLKVMDFGLAQMANAEQQTKAPKEYAVGTPGYMPPEQVGGEPMDHRGDLYSVGVILYQLLSGRMPFAGETMMEILMAQHEGGPPTFASIGLADKVPPPVEYVIRACLEVDPEERPQNARELGDVWEQALVQSYGGSAKDDDAPPPRAVAPPPAPAPEAPPAEIPGAADPNTIVEHLEAFMPEQIAMYKLRGFVEEVGGTIVDSKPGLIRVRVKVSMGGGSGLFSLFGARRVGSVDLELHMRNKDPKQKNLLHITMLMRATDGGKLPNTSDWKARQGLIHSTLKAYLMGSSG